MKLRLFMPAAGAAGAVGAAALALLLPAGERGAAGSGDPLAVAIAGTPSGPLRVEPGRRPSRERGGTRVDGPVRVVRRANDPRGGPRWALRTYVGRHVWREANGRLRAYARQRCIELVREHDGRLGWIDGENVFRPVAPGAAGVPQQCRDLRGPTHVPMPPQRLTLVTDLARAPVRPLATVRWGFREQGDRSPLLLVGAAARRGETRVEFRTPDPAGGLPWAVPATAVDGQRACVAWPLRAVGPHVGRPVPGLDVIQGPEELGGRACMTSPAQAPPLTRHRPLAVASGSSSEREPGADAAVRRVARRTLQGHTVLVGLAHRDVAQVTIASPRDVRTLTPSPRERVFAVVWDGQFPTGDITLDARMRDGSVRTQVVRLWRW